MYSMPLRDDRGELPLYTDVRMDCDAGVPVWSGGEPVLVDTARYRFSHFSWSYGCELEALVGQPYTADAKLSEAERYVTEALLVSPYIREARVRDKRFEGSTLHMQVALSTVYGKETIYV